MEANRSASGCAAAKARRTRLAVSTMRAAILIRRIRKVVNSALANAWGLASDRTSCRSPLANQCSRVAHRGARSGYPLCRNQHRGRHSTEWLYDTLYCARGSHHAITSGRP
jgi:hypothetical protein